MVRMSIGDMEWGFTSLSNEEELDLDLLFNDIAPPIVDRRDGTKLLKFGVRLRQGIPREGWEIGRYNVHGFEEALLDNEQDGDNLEAYKRIPQQDLQAPAAFRYALGQISIEFGCQVWYRFHALHLGLAIENYKSEIFDEDQFIIWFGERLDQLIIQYRPKKEVCMVQTLLGPMKWGFTSFSDEDEEDVDLWFNEIAPPIVDQPDGTKRLEFGFKFRTNTSPHYWEIGYYNPWGFERALYTKKSRDANDIDTYLPVKEEELLAPAAFRYALQKLGDELFCKPGYRFNASHIGIWIEGYWSVRFDKDEFLVWLGNRLDFFMTEYNTRV